MKRASQWLAERSRLGPGENICGLGLGLAWTLNVLSQPVSSNWVKRLKEASNDI
jgi:hypothetical protein